MPTGTVKKWMDIKALALSLRTTVEKMPSVTSLASMAMLRKKEIRLNMKSNMITARGSTSARRARSKAVEVAVVADVAAVVDGAAHAHAHAAETAEAADVGKTAEIVVARHFDENCNLAVALVSAIF